MIWSRDGCSLPSHALFMESSKAVTLEISNYPISGAQRCSQVMFTFSGKLSFSSLYWFSLSFLFFSL